MTLIDLKLDDMLDFNNVFTTWTTVVFGILGIVIALSIYNIYRSKKDVDEALSEYKKIIEESKNKLEKVEEMETKLEKTYEINNILSSVIMNISEKNYWFAIDSIKKALEIDSNNVLFNYYYARCSFLEVQKIEENRKENNEEMSEKDIELAFESLEAYLKVLNNITEDQQNTYNLGVLFPNINIYEMTTLSLVLLNSNECGTYLDIVRKVLEEMRKEMQIKQIQDFAYMEQTDVSLMNYRCLLKELGLKMLYENNSFGVNILDEYLTIASYSKYYLDTYENDEILDTLDRLIEFNKYDSSAQSKYIGIKTVIQKEIEDYGENGSD
ncbi:MAG: hypothetical protein HFF36_04550 [Coprobacillus sp.]|nr:hypothetical protein [Coprobacillus sp.]